MKFRGSIDDLRQVVESTGIDGKWSGPDGQKVQFRTDDGAILNWWSKTYTLQFQGPEDPTKRLNDAFAAAIEGRKPGIAAPAAAVKPQIFVVHGHDPIARDQLELVLRRLDL